MAPNNGYGAARPAAFFETKRFGRSRIFPEGEPHLSPILFTFRETRTCGYQPRLSLGTRTNAAGSRMSPKLRSNKVNSVAFKPELVLLLDGHPPLGQNHTVRII